MLCEQYKNALTEAAAKRSEPQETLRAHLAACAHCSASFAAERQLFAAIDNGLNAAVIAEVPASLLPRLRARLDEEAVPRRGWVPAWAAVAASAALVIGFFVIRGRQQQSPLRDPNHGEVARNILPSEPMPARTGHSSGTAAKKVAAKRSSPRIAASVSATTDQESRVLLPPRQQEALTQLLVGLLRGEIKGEVLLANASDSQPQDLRIPPLEVSPIEVKPLEDLSPQGQ